MCLGVLFVVIALKILVQKPKYTYLKIFGYLLITVLSYQGELNFFPLLAILIYILKQIKENKKIGTFLKEFFIEMFKLALITITVLAISMVVIHIGKTLLNNTESKLVKIVSYRTFRLRLTTVKRYTNELWNNCIHMLPKYSLDITIIATFVLLLFLGLVAFASAILPLFVFNVGICGRISVPLTMIFGISAFTLIANAIQSNKNYQINIATTFTILMFIINGSFIVQNTAEHIAANRVDENVGATIKALIEKYEKENNITVTKFGYRYDFEPQQFSVGIKPMQSMTERKFACSWSAEFSMNYYCNRKFEVVAFKYPEIQDYHSNNYVSNYKAFSEEQIFFDGDTVYMVIY